MSNELQQLASGFYYSEHFGFDKPLAETHPDQAALMAAALMAVAAGDRVLSPQERVWIAGYFAAMQYSGDFVQALVENDAPEIEDIVDLMQSGEVGLAKRIVIYDAIRAASADGHYNRGERAAITDLARSFGLADDTIYEIEELVEAEELLKRQRIELLLPEGHPNLAHRYTY